MSQRHMAAASRQLSAVPSTAEVRLGVAVNIVLKADQPTGRTVQGVVQELLTRGNHPRGIKVRLRDGRVGRVQSIAASSELSGTDGGLDVVAAPEDAEALNGGEPQLQVKRHGDFTGRRGRYTDVRLDGELDKPAEQIGLDAYIRPGKPKKGKSRKPTSSDAVNDKSVESVDGNQQVESVTCPVCGEFTGDAAAVEHHVATHFDV
jgi:uncharacterized repeat protein (TIGR03833 family)